jgi:hypothetical protein
MEQAMALIGVVLMGWCLRWRWDVPRGTNTPADFEEKKHLYEQEEQRKAQTDQTEEKSANMATFEPSGAKIRISSKMVETVKIGDKWYDVVDARFFEVSKT